MGRRKEDDIIREWAARMGAKGGKARLTTMSPEERSERARQAVLVRWSNSRQSQGISGDSTDTQVRGKDMSVKFRRFQVTIDQYLDEVCSGSPIRNLLAECTPGSGKSTIPMIVASRLIAAGRADFIAWYVPRLNLAEQAEGDFADIGKVSFNSQGYRIRQSTNDRDPCRGLQGFVTTYHSLTHDNYNTVLDQFSKRRGILVLDEPHHLKKGREWHNSLKDIWKKASFRILMSGRMSRWDKKQIAFAPYKMIDDEDSDQFGRYALQYDHPKWKYVPYTREEALNEHAKIPLVFYHVDGAFCWENNGQRYTASSFKEAGDDGLYVALKTDYANHLLEDCVNNYTRERQYHSPRAKLLVVCANINQAKPILALLRSRWPSLKSDIAVSHDGTDNKKSTTKQALAAIERFKRFDSTCLDALVTVAMAYEGLDVPSISHLACLTHIRSWEWIEQMLDRATRFDTKGLDWHQQLARAWVPDDDQMNYCIERIQQEQADTARIHQGLQEEERGDIESGTGAAPISSPVPINGAMTEKRISGEQITGDTEKSIDNAQVSHIEHILQEVGPILSADQFKRAFDMYSSKSTPSIPNDQASTICAVKPSQEEKAYKDAITEYVPMVDRHYYNGEFGTTNKTIYETFGKRRKDMRTPELKRVLEFLKREYPRKW